MANQLRTVERIGASFPTADELLHGLSLLIAFAEVALASGFPHQFRDGCLSTPGLSVKGAPEMIIQLKLCPPHNVC